MKKMCAATYRTGFRYWKRRMQMRNGSVSQENSLSTQPSGISCLLFYFTIGETRLRVFCFHPTLRTRKGTHFMITATTLDESKL